MRSLCVRKILLDVFTTETANMASHISSSVLQNFYEISVSIPCKILFLKTILLFAEREKERERQRDKLQVYARKFYLNDISI